MFHALWHPPLAYATDFIIQWLANLASPLPLRHLQCPGALASHLPMGIPRNPVVPCEVRYDWIRYGNMIDWQRSSSRPRGGTSSSRRVLVAARGAALVESQPPSCSGQWFSRDLL